MRLGRLLSGHQGGELRYPRAAFRKQTLAQWTLLYTLLVILLACGPPKSVKLADTIRRENPIGSRVDQVESFLKKNKIYYEHSESQGRDIIRGIVRNVSKQNLVRTDLQLTFEFDDRNQLKDLDIKELLTGP